MNTTPEQIDIWRSADTETQRLEFKEAKTQFDNRKLYKYCVALANEGGGHLLLGIADTPPLPVVGTAAFDMGMRSYLNANPRKQGRKMQLAHGQVFACLNANLQRALSSAVSRVRHQFPAWPAPFFKIGSTGEASSMQDVDMNNIAYFRLFSFAQAFEAHDAANMSHNMRCCYFMIHKIEKRGNHG